jgi:ADP-heptose:LPS heptosyltransferase
MNAAEPAIGAGKAARLQRLDGILGPPLCALLTVCNRLLPHRMPDAPPSSIGFVKLGEQGSTVLAIAAINEAVRRVGRENVCFVVFAENRKILDVLGLIPPGNIFEIRTSSIAAFLVSVLRVTALLRRRALGACIDLDFFARSSAILSWMTGAPRRVGLHPYFGEGPYRGGLTTHRPRYNPHIHTARLFLALVHALDEDPARFPAWNSIPDLPPLPVLEIPEDKLGAMQKRLCQSFGTEAPPPLILLNANCSDMIPLRRWASENFLELARRILAHDPRVCIVFTGAPVEEEESARLAAAVASPRCVSYAGKTTLGELFALYTCARALVTNDSGPAHFASITPARVIALFGPETPALFGPLSPGSVPISAGLPCSPCVSAQNNRLSACRNNICMHSISVERVLEEVLKIPGIGADAGS